jgi:cell wall-associated NlpC family hydrolase
MPNGSQLAGYGFVVAGGWLLNSAYRNRSPIGTLVSIFRDPKNARALLTASPGTLKATLPTAANAAFTTGGSGTGGADGVLAWARQQIGKPYRWGATGPDAFDCSGLVQQAYVNGAGVKLPRTTQFMIGVGQKVAKSDLQLGDLVFPDAGHVQLYSGPGTIIEAPAAGEQVREVKMWGFMTARRVLGTSTTPASTSSSATMGPVV